MFLNKIKQNLAGFAAVVIAATALTAIAPANAVGTSVTTSQVAYTSVQRSNSTVTANSVAVSATVGADETMSNIWANLELADSTHIFTAQAGDSIKLTATYANVTDNSTASYLYASCTDWNARSAVSPYGWTYGNGCTSVTGANNVVSKTTALTSLAAGTYDNLSVNQNFNITDSSISAGDQLTLTVAAYLVRGGVDTAINLATGNGQTNELMMNFNKVGTVNHTAAATDSYINFNSNFCVFNGENGVTNNTQIDVTVTNTVTGNNIGYVSGDASIYGGMNSITGTTSGNTRSYVLPASGWDVVRFNAWASVYANDVTVGQTFTPVITAVIHGTSTSVLDLCARSVPGMAAPTATPSNSTGVGLSWTAPTLPVAGNWDMVRVYACPTTLNTCGNYTPMSGYYMPGARPQFATNRSTGVIAVNATSYTANASNMQTYMTGPGQVAATWTTSASLQYFVVYEDAESPFYAVSALSSATSAGGQVQQVQQNNVAPTLPTTIPVVAPIKVPVLGVAPGASLVLAGENMKSLTSVKIGANAATTKTTIAGLEVVVPADLAPGAHDLLIATSTGSTLFVGAIKVADPVVVAAKAAQAKAAASVSFRAPVDLTVSKSVTGSQAAQVKALASQYKSAKTAICEAIPASKATVASARAAAVKVCATIKAAIPGIKTEIVVSAPSGAKANRVSSEIQG